MLPWLFFTAFGSVPGASSSTCITFPICVQWCSPRHAAISYVPMKLRTSRAPKQSATLVNPPAPLRFGSIKQWPWPRSLLRPSTFDRSPTSQQWTTTSAVPSADRLSWIPRRPNAATHFAPTAYPAHSRTAIPAPLTAALLVRGMFRPHRS